MSDVLRPDVATWPADRLSEAVEVLTARVQTLSLDVATLMTEGCPVHQTHDQTLEQHGLELVELREKVSRDLEATRADVGRLVSWATKQRLERDGINAKLDRILKKIDPDYSPRLKTGPFGG